MKLTPVLAICLTFATSAPAIWAAGNAAKGKATFEQCAICHNADSDDRCDDVHVSQDLGIEASERNRLRHSEKLYRVAEMSIS